MGNESRRTSMKTIALSAISVLIFAIPVLLGTDPIPIRFRSEIDRVTFHLALSPEMY